MKAIDAVNYNDHGYSMAVMGIRKYGDGLRGQLRKQETAQFNSRINRQGVLVISNNPVDGDYGTSGGNTNNVMSSNMIGIDNIEIQRQIRYQQLQTTQNNTSEILRLPNQQ